MKKQVLLNFLASLACACTIIALAVGIYTRDVINDIFDHNLRTTSQQMAVILRQYDNIFNAIQVELNREGRKAIKKIVTEIGKGMVPRPVRVEALEFSAWAKGSGHKTDNAHDLAHAVGDYVNKEDAKISPCSHMEFPLGLPEGMPCLATITVFGERPEEPEVMSVVLHRSDGSVLKTLEILANDYSPQQAWQMAMTFLDDHQPLGVLHDKAIRKPQFCSDCNSLLVHVASREDIDAVMNGQT